jgi:hypothetical protein
MSQQITTAFVEQYSSTLQHLVQQRDSRFAGKTRTESQKGKSEFFEQLGATAAVKRTSRHADTPRVDSNHQRRAVYLNDYEWSDLIDQQDKIKLLIDPASSYLMAAKMAFNRSKDDEIIAAATGTAYADTGSGNGAVSAVTFPSSTTTNTIVVNYINGAPAGSGANTGLTLAKVIRANSMLETAEPPEGSRKFLVVSRQQIDDMLNNVAQVSSKDYADVKALQEGTITKFGGFEWIRTERTTRNTSTDIDTCFAYVEEGLLLSVGEDIVTRVSERSDKSYAVQPYARMSIGATRMQEPEVVSIACDRSP